MQRTKSKILSILLSLVMLLSLLPTTALAAGNYPIDVALYNNAKKLISLSDKQYLATNGATEASIGYDGTQNYVARYDKSSGTLFLKGYDGVGAEGGIAAVGDLNIKVEHDSSFTASRTSTDNLMGIQASGKLNISGPGKLTLRATAPGYAYGIFAKDGIEISAPLDVTVKLNDSTKNRLLYGIYTKSGAISLSGNDMTVTVTGGTGTVYGVYNNASTPAITDNGNIDISGKLTVNLNNGKSNHGISSQGGVITLNDATVNIPGNFRIGIYNNNRNVVIKNNSDVTLTSAISNGSGVYARYGGDLIIENSTVKVSTNGYTADVSNGKLSIKDSIVDLTLENNHYRVVATDNNAMNTIDLSGSSSGSVTLTASGKQTSAMIGGKVTATSGTKLEKGTHYPGLETYDGEYDTVSDKTVLKFVHESAAPKTLSSIAVTTAPTKTIYTAGENFDPAGMVVTATYSDSSTADVTSYTVTDGNNLTAGKTSVTISYTEGGKTETCTQAIVVNAAAKTLSSIAVTTAPTKTTYTAGENFDPAGMVVTATYSDSSTADVTGYTVTDGNSLTAGKTSVTISYTEGGKTETCTQAITVNAAPTEYTITFNGNGGTPSVGTMSTAGGKLTSLPTATRSGSYSFDGWYTAASGGTQITTAYTFSADTTVHAHWTYTGGGGGGGGSYTPSYTVSVDKTVNGTITVSPKSASKGDTVTVTVKPDKGYELDTLKVLDKNGDKVKLTEKNGKYTFTMPAGKVTVKGSFVEEAPGQIFTDVPVDAYCYEAVKWAAEKGITGGVGNGLFAPNQPCTRAQIVTFLWRAAGSPTPKNMSSFADVPADAFYAKAVAWAVENGITGGTGDGKFSPDATCTRAQAVTFLYRASGAPAVSGNAAFSDVAANAYYAAAVKWAEKNGITGGIGGGLFGSNNNCTRGQIVTFLYRAMK